MQQRGFRLKLVERSSAGKEDAGLHTSSGSPTRRVARAAALAPATLGCAPTVDVLGVYFPGWLVSAVLGFSVAYGAVRWLAGRPATRELGRSGVLFCSLTLVASLLLWWVLFSRY